MPRSLSALLVQIFITPLTIFSSSTTSSAWVFPPIGYFPHLVFFVNRPKGTRVKKIKENGTTRSDQLFHQITKRNRRVSDQFNKLFIELKMKWSQEFPTVEFLDSLRKEKKNPFFFLFVISPNQRSTFIKTSSIWRMIKKKTPPHVRGKLEFPILR